MKRALAERAAKQSSLPNTATKKPSVAVVAAHSLQQQQQQHQLHPASSSVVQSPSSPEVHPPPMKIPRLQHNNKTASSASFQQPDSARGGGGAAAAGPFQSSSVSSTALSSSSSSLPVNHHHHNMHLASSAAATGGGGESTDAVSSGARRGYNSQHHDHHHQEAETPSAAATAGGAASTKSKRQRNSIENHHHSNSNNDHREDQAEEEEEEDEETKASGFYLKHQNRALATELSSLQAAVAELTAEREYRRRTCLEAVQALHSLQATWTSLEAALGHQQHQQQPHHAPTSSSPASQHHDARTPSSTAGSTPETAVEWTVALHDALQALGSSSSNSSQNQPDGKGGIVADTGDTSHSKNRHAPQPPPPRPPPDPAVADLGRIAANVSSRANCLQEWIWNLLQLTPEERRRMGNNFNNDDDAAMKNNGENDDAADNQDSTTLCKNKINNNDANAPFYWKHSCQRLETQVLELTQSRNQIAQRERKLRRNMYRLAAGMMTQQQVLQQAIHSPDGTTDEHEEFLAATAMAAASANHGTTTTMTAVAANGLGGNNNNINNNSLDHSDHRGNSNGNSDASLLLLSSSLPIKEEQGPGYSVGGIKLESSSMLPQHDGSSSSMEQVGSSTTGGATTLVALASGSAGGDGSGGKFMSFAAVDEMKLQLRTARQQVMQGENTIQELNATLQERELRINQLTTKQQSEEDVQRLILLEATTCKLDVANQKVAELEEKLTRLKTEWAQSAGNDQALRESMKEMQDKHHKRWSELTTIWSATSNAEAPASGDDNNSESSNGGVATGEANTTDAEEGLATTTSTTSAAEAAALGAESQERKIMELEHKLSQALENVRQAETARNNLKTALSMNTTLQGKLDDLKHKYAAAVAAAAEQRSNSSSSNANPNANSSSSRSNNNTSSTDVSSALSGGGGGGGGGSSTPRERDSSSSTAAASTSAAASGSTHTNQERADKLYRDNKRMKKEIAAIMASKEAHKAKIERVEKERDGLMDANARLLKQVTENDEMNAKSLSTILHLKSMTEQLKTERDNLEQQVKSASQLALASRLASNAKDRVSEEMLKEKNAIHEHLTELETTHAATKEELNRITLEWSQADGKTAAIRSELGNALQRCDELVAQIEEKREEIRKLVAALDKAEQEARDAKKKLAESAAADSMNNPQRRMSGGGAGAGDNSTSNFTVEQLNTQISFLKGRLACPVCHYRDKQCIIMRCRHMHCKQCVDEQISNRSRKCPSCNGKFSEKDVEDVWLD